jgi:hypothetical protein
MKVHVVLFFFSSLLLLSACGVKGKPQPPLTAPVLGRGEPNFSKATESVKLKKKTPPPHSDWDDNKDFSEDRSQ